LIANCEKPGLVAAAGVPASYCLPQ